MKHVILTTGFMRPHWWNYGIVYIHNQLKSLGISTKLYAWNQVDQTVEDIKKLIDDDLELIMVGHSYGVSSGVFVCEKLKKLYPNFKIDHFISVDGIWRPDVYWPSFRSLHDGQIITIPDNIENLYSFSQRKGILQGHAFNISHPVNWLVNEIIEDYRHFVIDGIPELEKLILKLSV